MRWQVEDVAMDPTDVSWLEKDQKEEDPQVKTLNSRDRARGSLQDSEMSEFDDTMVCPEVYSMVK